MKRAQLERGGVGKQGVSLVNTFERRGSESRDLFTIRINIELGNKDTGGRLGIVVIGGLTFI